MKGRWRRLRRPFCWQRIAFGITDVANCENNEANTFTANECTDFEAYTAIRIFIKYPLVYFSIAYTAAFCSLIFEDSEAWITDRTKNTRLTFYPSF
jgi:hypothetical protein